MRRCARIALVTLIMSAGGLAGCGSTDELSETFNGWLSGGKSPTERHLIVPDDAPGVTDSVSPDYRPAKKTRRSETSKPLRKKVKEVRRPEQPQSEEAPSSPSRRVRPTGQPQAGRQTGETPRKPSSAAAPAALPKTEQPKDEPTKTEPQKAEPPKPDQQKPAQTKPAQPDASEPQSASSKPPQLRLKTLWPDAPASGTFSR
jgi:hypothetical protein